MMKTIHGFNTRRFGQSCEYVAWAAMLQRCKNKKHKSYKHYGGRGISVCRRWLEFRNFLADMGLKPSQKHSIDRINNDGNYDPGNCRWATFSRQAANRRNNRIIKLYGVEKTLSKWASDFGIKPAIVAKRISRGWSVSESLRSKPGTRLKMKKGESCHSNKLSKRDAKKAMKCSRIKGAASRLARKLGVSVTLVCKIRDGKCWKHLHK